MQKLKTALLIVIYYFIMYILIVFISINVIPLDEYFNIQGTDHIAVVTVFILLDIIVIIVLTIIAFAFLKLSKWHLVAGFPILPTAIVLYCPEGIYFCWPNTGFFLSKPLSNLTMAILISISIAIIQSIALSLCERIFRKQG